MSSQAFSLAPGTVLDERYRIDETLAKTRFSAIYRATQLSTRQPVAVKFLETRKLSSSARGEFERRFRREMSIYAGVRHPHLVRLFDTGRTDEDLYLVLEFIEGKPLSRIIRDEGQLEPFEAKRLMGQCLDALSAGHSRGIVHRDFKPSNVMITRTGSDRHAVVLDFGLAGLTRDVMRSEPGTKRPITAPGTAPGTPSYMAPEQLDGHVTPKSDIYAWGLVYVECLTGKRAVTGRTEVDTLLKQVREPLELPGWLAEQPLGQIIQRATAKKLDARYESADAVLEELKTCPMEALSRDREIVSIELVDDAESEQNEQPLETLSNVPSVTVTELASDIVEISASDVHMISAPSEDGGDLEALFRDYSRVCTALGLEPELPREAFVERARLEAASLRSRLGCASIRYRIVVENEQVRLQPIPE